MSCQSADVSSTFINAPNIASVALNHDQTPRLLPIQLGSSLMQSVTTCAPLLAQENLNETRSVEDQ